MKLWKRNAVVSVIVLFIFVALYLSWAYGRAPEEGDATVFDPNNIDQPALSDEDSDPNPLDVSLTDPDIVTEDGGEVLSGGSMFDEFRLSRKQSRDSALAILTEAVERDTVSQDVRDNASTEIEKLVSNAMTEVVIENMILAKGFEECVVFINQEGVKVVVASPDGGMTEADAAKLTDIIVAESGSAVTGINIVPVEA